MYYELATQLNSYADCTDYEGFLACVCTNNDISEFPTLVVEFAKEKIEIAPKNYLIYDEVYEECYSIADVGNYEMILLGDTFLKGQYIIHDMGKKRLAFGYNPDEAQKQSIKLIGMLLVFTFC